MEQLELAVSSIFDALRWVTQKLLLLPPPKDAFVPVVPVGRGAGPLAAVRPALCRTQPLSCSSRPDPAALLPSGSLDSLLISLMALSALLGPAAWLCAHLPGGSNAPSSPCLPCSAPLGTWHPVPAHLHPLLPSCAAQPRLPQLRHCRAALPRRT